MQGGYIRQERPYVTFAALLVSEKYDERKVTLCLYGGSKPPPYAQSPSIANIQSEKYILHSVGARAKPTPAMHLLRACRQCVHESARLSRAICSHVW